MGVRRDEPFPIQPRANGVMAAVLQVAAGAALLLGLAGVLAPDPAGRMLSWASVGLVVSAPLLRVAWLVLRWVQRRDWAFAGLAALLLAIVAVGAVVAVALRG